MVLQSFALVHRELFCSTLEINLIFGHINVLFSNLIYDIFSKNFLGNMYRQELFSRIHKLYKSEFCYGLSCLCHYIYIYIYVYNPSPLHKSIRIIYMNKKLSSNLTQLPENGYTLETRSSNNIIISFISSYIRLPLTELSTLGSISNA